MASTASHELNEHLANLQNGPAHRFADGAHPNVPNVCCGVYTIWDGDLLVYVDMPAEL
jgi:hypothetical protein